MSQGRDRPRSRRYSRRWLAESRINRRYILSYQPFTAPAKHSQTASFHQPARRRLCRARACFRKIRVACTLEPLDTDTAEEPGGCRSTSWRNGHGPTGWRTPDPLLTFASRRLLPPILRPPNPASSLLLQQLATLQRMNATQSGRFRGRTENRRRNATETSPLCNGATGAADHATMHRCDTPM